MSSTPAPEPSDISDTETDPGYRSRSQSRRARRRKQQGSKKQSMPSVPENQQASAQSAAKSEQPDGSQAEAKSKALAQEALDDMSPQEQVEAMGMQPFEHIGPGETSMSGPVTYAMAQRGEIAPRRGNPSQGLQTGSGEKQGGEKDPMDQDGLKLRLELNIDVEIELKAKIHGDLTLALLA